MPNESITAVVGASGSGKTTLLRLIAGFERVDAGSIAIGDVVVDDGHHFERAERRGVGYVPQEGALFPHLNVARNIAFGVPKKDRGRLGDLVDLVGLSGLEGRYPHQLSGGQQQRVALARALAIRPAVVLLDEPFSSLDATLRVGLGRDVVRVLKKSGTTAVLVTHDQDEALALADQIAVLRGGRVKACADPRSLYYDPPDLEIAASIGEANILPARIDGDRAMTALGPIRFKGDMERRPPVNARCSCGRSSSCCTSILHPDRWRAPLMRSSSMATMPSCYSRSIHRRNGWVRPAAARPRPWRPRPGRRSVRVDRSARVRKVVGDQPVTAGRTGRGVSSAMPEGPVEPAHHQQAPAPPVRRPVGREPHPCNIRPTGSASACGRTTWWSPSSRWGPGRHGPGRSRRWRSSRWTSRRSGCATRRSPRRPERWNTSP